MEMSCCLYPVFLNVVNDNNFNPVKFLILCCWFLCCITFLTFFNFMQYLFLKIIYNIIYYDFLPPPCRGSHVKSDNTYTII